MRKIVVLFVLGLFGVAVLPSAQASAATHGAVCLVKHHHHHHHHKK